MDNSLLKNQNLYMIFSITLFAVMGVSSITPAFPSIIEYFDLTAQEVGYLITAFTLPGVLLAPFMGVLADRFGRKTILIPSLFLFGLAGTACAFQEQYQYLLIARFFQGVGAASLGSLNVTIIGDLFKGQERVKAMGYNASVLSLGTASFPAIGGLLAGFDWSFVFVLPILVVPVAFWVLFKLPINKVPVNSTVKNYLKKVWGIINQKQVWGLFIINVLLFIILYGAFLSFFPLLMDTRFKANSKAIGITMSLMSLTTALCSSQLGKVRKKFAAHQLLVFSSAMYLVSLVVIGWSPNWAVLIVGTLLFGVGHGFLIPNLQTALVGFAPVSERAAFMSINSMVLRLGQSLGPIVVAFFYFSNNLSMVFFISAAIPLLMILVLVTMVGKLREQQ